MNLSDLIGEITKEAVKTPFKVAGGVVNGLSELFFGEDIW